MSGRVPAGVARRSTQVVGAAVLVWLAACGGGDGGGGVGPPPEPPVLASVTLAGTDPEPEVRLGGRDCPCARRFRVSHARDPDRL